MTTAEPSLRERQIVSVERLLNLNHSTNEESNTHQDLTAANGSVTKTVPILDADGEPIWKVLVFDNLGRDVISSILHVSDLRAWGVTIHLNIKSTRYAIPDVPVLYLVEPTAENIEIIASDLKKGLYSPAYVNFLYSISRPLLEDFASQIATLDISDSISQVYDQYLNFIVSEPNLFSLGMGKNVYATMSSPTISDADLDSKIDQIVSGLFSVVVTIGSIPIIRCPKGGPAEMVAAKLDRKLRDHILNAKDNLFAKANARTSAAATTSSRPILILVDRNVDLVPMLSHSWTYQSLVHDVLKVNLNRITIDEVDPDKPDAPPVKRSYDLKSTDFFWARNASEPFPTVAENLDAEIKRYKDDASEITNKTGASSIDDLQNDVTTSTRHQHFKAAISKLPELRERKTTIDMHTKIASALLKGVGARGLDTFYQLEETISKQSKKQMLDILADTDKGNEPLDKLRLFIIWYLSTDQKISQTEMDQFVEALRSAGANTAPLTYVRREAVELKKSTMITSAPTQQIQSSASNDLLRGFSSLSKGLTDRFKEAGIGANLDNLISGVKNFLPVNQDSTLTKIVESLMDPSNASTSALQKTEAYLYFDPRNASARGTMPSSGAQGRDQGGANVTRGIEASFGQRRQGFCEAIVFTVGGGSMDEYGNLQEWAKRTTGQGAASVVSRKRIVYGSTELVNALDFVDELASLGKGSS